MRRELGTCREWLPGAPPIGNVPGYGWTAHSRRAFAGVWEQVRRVGKGLLTARSSRRLKVVETMSLGDKRFVSILHIDGEEFLLGGSASSIVVLAKLDGVVAANEPFCSVLSRQNREAPQSGDHGGDLTTERSR